MSERRADVVVIGAGIMGVSAAWRLAQRGLHVVLLEQFELGHVRGSSHGPSRIFRLAYDDVEHVRLAQQALPHWHDVEKALGTDLFWATGGLDIGPPEKLTPIADALSTASVPFELLSSDELRRRFPAYQVPAEWKALYQPDAAVTYAGKAWTGILELARRAGAEVHDNTRATRLLPENGGVTVETDRGRWRAHHVAVTTAAWSNQLLAPLGLTVPMRVTREHVAYYSLRDSHPVLPFMIHRPDSPFVFYGLPNAAATDIKVGEHEAGPEVDPDTSPVVEQARFERVQRLVRAHLPGLSKEPTATETCLYAMTPDDDFVIERAGPIILGTGFGGHGYKFGPLMGSVLADLVQGKPLTLGTGFGRQRFAEVGVVRTGTR